MDSFGAKPTRKLAAITIESGISAEHQVKWGSGNRMAVFENKSSSEAHLDLLDTAEIIEITQKSNLDQPDDSEVMKRRLDNLHDVEIANTAENVLEGIEDIEITKQYATILADTPAPSQDEQFDESQDTLTDSLDEEDPTACTYALSIVIPTRNEYDNVELLLRSLREIFSDIHTEVLFVDDSDDQTPDKIQEVALTLNAASFHVHLEHRAKGPDRAGGLSTAVSLGLYLAQGHYVAVIDADLQHPLAQLHVLYDEIIKQHADLAIASRYIKGGSAEGLGGVSRRLFSVGFKQVSKMLFPGQLSRVSDPLSGFFLLKRSLLKGVVLRPIGYKILLEILLRCPWRDLIEVPYHFQARQSGQSKADLNQGLMAFQHMARLFREIPAAGRVWKVCALLLFNLAVLASLYFLYPFTTAFWQPFSVSIFALVAALNFQLLNRSIFPSLPRLDRSIPLPDQTDRSLASANFDDESDTLITRAPVPPETPSPPPSQKASLLQRLRRVFFQKISIQRRFRQITFQQDKPFMSLTFPLILAAMASVGYMALDLTTYTIPNAWVILAAVLFGSSIIIGTSRSKIDIHRIITVLLAIAMGITFVDYLSWRIEVINWSGWWLALPLLFAEFLGATHTLGLQFTLWPRPQPRLQHTVNITHAPIFIFIPTVNEGVSILKATIQGVLTARDHYLAQYPWGQVNIVICNDGYVAKVADWRSIEVLARKMGIQCITRKKPGGAKAGNIENARQLVGATGKALIVIFDADQVAKADFLLKTIPNMADPRVGWVQTGQYYCNLDNPVTNWADDQQSMFYNLLCPGKATWNATFICGTNVVIRAQALDEIGGLPQDSVTEDFAASINLHTRWRSVYIRDILATGLGPMDLSAYLKQQRRWAIGTLGVMRTHWRDILLPQKNGLRIGQRLQYFLACTHYLCGLRDLLYMICPILFIFSGIPAVQGSTLNAFILHFLPYFLVSSATIWYAGRGITGLRGIVMGFGSFPVLIEALITVILQRKVGFTVTSKKRASQNSGGYLWVYLFFIVLCLSAIVYSSQAKATVYSALVISLLWIAYTLIMLCSFLWLYFLDWRKQRAERLLTEHAEPERFVYPARLPQQAQALSSALNSGLALMLAACLFLAGTFHPYGPPAPSYPLQLAPNRVPYLGVDLPVSLLKQRPAQLEQILGTGFAIVGRTQDTSDAFDTVWAENLEAYHARPWITLQFGLFQANGKPTDGASLLSIAHGLHDDELTRWAQAIRAYGKPVFLTILLHADRNWSLSSAVTNGGIPQDVPPAWLHVESLFKHVGANNVSWLWSPADPINDQPYAPPAASIDGVVLDLISYPHTTWGDPETLAQSVIERYPGKPILIEVSAAGPAAQKAAWLTKVGATAVSHPAIYALIYHDASPSLTPDASLDHQWSMTSDAESLAVMRKIANQLRH